MTTLRSTTLDSAIGELTIGVSDRGVAAVRFDRARWPAAAPLDGGEPAAAGEVPLLDRAVTQLTEYLAGERTEFDLPLDLAGVTSFQREVLTAMCGIAYGELATYGELAEEAGRPRAARAVGGACNANPIPLIVPCHRVIAADGSLGGYGAGLGIKRYLLDLERGAVPDGGWAPAA